MSSDENEVKEDDNTAAEVTDYDLLSEEEGEKIVELFSEHDDEFVRINTVRGSVITGLVREYDSEKKCLKLEFCSVYDPEGERSFFVKNLAFNPRFFSGFDAIPSDDMLGIMSVFWPNHSTTVH